jgi:hypothetical protein
VLLRGLGQQAGRQDPVRLPPDRDDGGLASLAGGSAPAASACSCAGSAVSARIFSGVSGVTRFLSRMVAFSTSSDRHAASTSYRLAQRCGAVTSVEVERLQQRRAQAAEKRRRRREALEHAHSNIVRASVLTRAVCLAAGRRSTARRTLV